jgi:NitT/TauT family transport system substrate-binding protein
MDRRSFLGTSAALGLSATAREARAQTLTPMTIAPLSGPSDAALYYAQQQGWFRQAGLDLTIQPTANGPAAMSALVGGSIHASEGNILSLAGAHAKGIPMTLIAPGSVFDASGTPSVRLVASTSTSSTVKSPKDLGGKTVAVPSLSDLLSISTRSLIDKSGGDSNAVHFVELPPNAMGAALQAQRIDAAGMYEPFLSGALAQGARPIGVPYAALAPKFMIVAWFAYGPWAQTHREAVAAFVSVINRAAAYANAHARELIPLISGFSHIPEDVLATMQIVQIASTLDPALIQPIINAAAKYKVIPQAFPAKELIFS